MIKKEGIALELLGLPDQLRQHLRSKENAEQMVARWAAEAGPLNDAAAVGQGS